MAANAVSLDKEGARIRAMFTGVAHRYDLLNHVLSLSLDQAWRRRLARSLDLPAGSRVLDLCSGTGDQSTALERRGYRVAAADFCLPMLALSRPKFGRLPGRRPAPLQADALALPFPDGSFDGVTASFGLRNVSDIDRAVAEIARVLRPGGQVGVLEFTIPVHQPLRGFYLFYFRRFLPVVGGWVSGDPDAYRYLPESVLSFPQRGGFVARLASAGLVEGRFQTLSLGILALYRARRGG
jgi:demethylmenaquinone methyltransferase/2-methoxy-6-polyprenyl-1,4-benzoquinol methylase